MRRDERSRQANSRPAASRTTRTCGDAATVVPRGRDARPARGGARRTGSSIRASPSPARRRARPSARRRPRSSTPSRRRAPGRARRSGAPGAPVRRLMTPRRRPACRRRRRGRRHAGAADARSGTRRSGACAGPWTLEVGVRSALAVAGVVGREVAAVRAERVRRRVVGRHAGARSRTPPTSSGGRRRRQANSNQPARRVAVVDAEDPQLPVQEHRLAAPAGRLAPSAARGASAPSRTAARSERAPTPAQG